MTTGRFELTFATTTKDWTRVQSLLNAIALRRQNMLVYILTHKGVMAGAMHALLLGVSVFALIHFLPKLLARLSAETFNATTVLVLILVAYALWMLVRCLWKLVTIVFASEETSRTGREGVHWGLHHVLATTESLSVRLSACHSVYDWGAFLGLKKTRDFLLLQLTPRSAVTIPRQAFKSQADEMDFCTFVRSRIIS